MGEIKMIQLEWESQDDLISEFQRIAGSAGATDFWWTVEADASQRLPRKRRVSIYKCTGGERIGSGAEATIHAFDIGLGIGGLSYFGQVRSQVASIADPSTRWPKQFSLGFFWQSGTLKNHLTGLDLDVNGDILGSVGGKHYNGEPGYIGLRNYWFRDSSDTGFLTTAGIGLGIVEICYTDPASANCQDAYLGFGIGLRGGAGYAFRLGNPTRFTIVADLGMDATPDSLVPHGIFQGRFSYRF